MRLQLRPRPEEGRVLMERINEALTAAANDGRKVGAIVLTQYEMEALAELAIADGHLSESEWKPGTAAREIAGHRIVVEPDSVEPRC